MRVEHRGFRLGLVPLAAAIFNRRSERALLRAHGLHIDEREPNVQAPQAIANLLIPASRADLSLERAHLPLDFAQNVIDARKIFIGGGQLAVRSALANLVLHDAGGFFEQLASLLRLIAEHHLDHLPLDHGIGAAAQTGVEKQLVDVAQTARDFVDEKLGLAVAEHPSRNGDFAELDRQDAGGIVDGETHFGNVQRFVIPRSVEDQILHLLTPKHARISFAQYPTQRVGDIRFPAAVRTDDDRDPVGKMNVQLAHE